MRSLSLWVLLGIGFLFVILGCTLKGGGLMPSAAGTASAMTWESTGGLTKTVAIVDIRTGENIWEKHIPAGHQLSVQFMEPRERVLQGDLGPHMMWGMHKIGKFVGDMEHLVDMPRAADRRIDVFMGRPKPYTPADISRPVTPLYVPMPESVAKRRGPSTTLTIMDTGEASRVSVIDTRTGDAALSVDLPAGHDLVMYFHPLSTMRARSGDMEQARWEVVPAGTTVTKPKNRAMVPSESHRDFELTPLPDPVPLPVSEAEASEATPASTEEPAPLDALPPADQPVADTPALPLPVPVPPLEDPSPDAATIEEAPAPSTPTEEVASPPPPPVPPLQMTPLSTQTWTDTGQRRRVSVIDTRSGEATFEVDVPKDHDLVLHFYDMWTPPEEHEALEGMHWQIVPAGTAIRTPAHHANVPPAAHRQVREQAVDPTTSDERP
ncbi:MAG: hypothetical protein MK100_00255 [Phycisphaerales bacterium]|nr:hypothetical protein [Phycisphaerales bacterium]